jgi:hypothetical protein
VPGGLGKVDPVVLTDHERRKGGYATAA